MACDPTPSMTSLTPSATTAAWTCPFCALLCEDVGRPAGEPAALATGSCSRASASLARLAAASDDAACRVDGVPTSLDAALEAGAQRLRRWRQPLFAGLATDIAGARAAYRLAARCGAILDHADGATLMHGLRALQDRGQYIATLAELRSRAEVVVCVGTPGVARFPEFFRRAGLGQPGSPCRRLVFIGAAPAAALPEGVAVDVLTGGDLFDDVQQLGAHVAGQRVHAPDSGLAALAEQLRASPYSVLVWEAGTLPREGALIVEGLNRIVGTLNRTTRAASLGLGGSDGGHSVNQTLAWLSGLPLRTRVATGAVRHEPHLFDTRRLVDGAGADGLLWVSSFDPSRLPPAAALPRIVLGPPAMAGALPMNDCVFIPVATPGLNAAGHLFRTDGPVVMQVHAARDDGLPGVASVLDSISKRLARP